jgi:hypothetical protein
MGHTKPSDLADLADVLAELAALPGLVEKKPGIFYRKGASFLHFHDKDGERWADVRAGTGWARVDVPFGAGAAAKKKLVAAAKKAMG